MIDATICMDEVIFKDTNVINLTCQSGNEVKDYVVLVDDGGNILVDDDNKYLIVQKDNKNGRRN